MALPFIERGAPRTGEFANRNRVTRPTPLPEDNYTLIVEKVGEVLLPSKLMLMCFHGLLANSAGTTSDYSVDSGQFIGTVDEPFWNETQEGDTIAFKIVVNNKGNHVATDFSKVDNGTQLPTKEQINAMKLPEITKLATENGIDTKGLTLPLIKQKVIAELGL